MRVLTYTRKRPGGAWTREPSEEGCTLRFSQLKLPQSFLELFGAGE